MFLRPKSNIECKQIKKISSNGRSNIHFSYY